MNNSYFTINYKRYHIHNDNDKIKPPDRYPFLKLIMSKMVILYRFTIPPRSYPAQILSCPWRQFLLRWRVSLININNVKCKMMHQFLFVLLKSEKRKLVRCTPQY